MLRTECSPSAELWFPLADHVYRSSCTEYDVDSISVQGPCFFRLGAVVAFFACLSCPVLLYYYTSGHEDIESSPPLKESLTALSVVISVVGLTHLLVL